MLGRCRVRWPVALALVICLGLPIPSVASDLSEVLMSKGMMYFDKGQYREAFKILGEALKEDPGQLEIRRYLFLAKARASGKASALELLREEAKEKPGDARLRLDLAAAFYMEGFLAEALGNLEEAYRLDPKCAEVFFFRGLVKLKMGQPREAIEDLQKARALEPKMGQASMFYEGLGLRQLRQHQAAQSMFQRVLEANPVSGYALEAAEQNRLGTGPRFAAKLTTGVEYDTNVTLEGRTTPLGVPLKAEDRFQVRFPFSALLDYRFLEVGEWSFGGRYGFYASVHDDSSDMNVVSNTGELYGVWRRAEWYVRPFYYYQSVVLGGEQLSDTHSVGASLMYYAPYNLAPELYLRGQSREYHFPTIDRSDADSWNLRAEYNQYYLLQKGRGYLKAGLGLEGNQADGSNLDYRSFLVLAGLQYQLPWELQFNFDFEYQRRSYDRIHTLFGVERDDSQYSMAWQLSRPLGKGFEVKGRVAYIRNDSSIGAFDYDRQIYSLLFSWNY